MSSPSHSLELKPVPNGSQKLCRANVLLKGVLQGVGFRPHVFRLANKFLIKGWTRNTAQGIEIEAEGPGTRLESFLADLIQKAPDPAFIQDVKKRYLEPVGYSRFQIAESQTGEAEQSLLLPDRATCKDCLREIFEPSERRYLYPFTNCTQCGPRYSLIESLPWDRSRTGMKSFPLCSLCRKEYEDPEDRRFHAQPICCPECGPHLELWDAKGNPVSSRQTALEETAQKLREGQIVAVKGVGGFHLMALAAQGSPVSKLRERKRRKEKPFALLYPSLEVLRQDCELSEMEAELLVSPAGPIVFVRRKAGEAHTRVFPDVAPGNPHFGVMLPSNPLHHLLMSEIRQPLICTSGNRTEEIICTEEAEALEQLSGIADYFLIHNRPIIRPAEDSIVQVVCGTKQILRRARGYAPLPISMDRNIPRGIAVGGHGKNTIAWSDGRNILVSPHLGYLGSDRTRLAFGKILGNLANKENDKILFIACDAHPDYASTRMAGETRHEVIPVQHHVAHAFSCMAENGIEPPCLAVVWDGTGYGADGSIWGGEFFHITEESIRRFATFRPFPLPGGKQSIREPRRCGLGVLFEALGEAAFEVPQIQTAFESYELNALKTLLKGKVNCPVTSSCGRLFDAVAFLSGFHSVISFEGQAAMALEFASENIKTEDIFPVNVSSSLSRGQEESGLPFVIDWEPVFERILQERMRGNSGKWIGKVFHNTLADVIVRLAKKSGENQVVLTGGCFQNKVLSQTVILKLRREKFRPYWHQRVPPNDGGLSLGQLVAASRPDKGKIQCALPSQEKF